MKTSEIRLMAAGIVPGQSDHRQLCPYCLGGSKGDKSFSITMREDGTILFCCHRVKCGKQGALSSTPRVGEDRPAMIPDIAPRREPPARQPLLARHRDRIWELYGLNEVVLEEFGVSSSVDGNLVAVPVRDHMRALRGWEYRQLPPYGPGPKSLPYATTKRVWGSVYASPEGDPEPEGIVVVEDVWSAMKVAQEVHEEFWAYSLMGSHMSIEHVADIARLNMPVILCLDEDAQSKAVGYFKKYSHLFGNFMEVRLSNKDLKYYNRRELLELLIDNVIIEDDIPCLDKVQ